jgi:hypothetical protein
MGLGLPDQGRGSAGLSGAGTPADKQQRTAFEAWAKTAQHRKKHCKLHVHRCILKFSHKVLS